MQPIVSVSVSLQNHLLILAFSLQKRVTSKSISVLKPWLVYMNSFAITLLHNPTLCSKNYSLTSLQGSTPIYSIILSTNTPRIMNQSIRPTPQPLYFIRMIPLTFPNFFYLLTFLEQNFFTIIFLMCISRFTRFPIPLATAFFMATTLQRQTTKRSDASTFFGSHFLPLFLSFQDNFICYATSKLLPQKRAHYSRRGPPAENDRRPEREAVVYTL